MKKEAKKIQDTGFGITGFVLGINSILMSLISPIMGIILGIEGLIFSILQNKKLKTRLATIGIVLNIIGIILSITIFITMYYLLISLTP